MSVENRLAELLLRWEEAWEHGEDLPATELCADCRELAESLQARINALKRTAWMNQEHQTGITDEGFGESPGAISPGTTLTGRYRIAQVIGEGGFGQVYRAFDLELKREVAIKISHRPGPEDRPNDLVEEARRIAQLHHPGIVAIHDVGYHDGRCFLVADLIEGTNLAERIATARPSPVDSARLVARIAEALHSAHEQGFVHRDIKPANILLDKFDRPLIADFGIATTAKELGDGEGATSGTLPYMAPEQVAGEVQLIDAKTDVYALGVILYELLTGELPYKGRTPVALREQILFKTPESIRAINRKVPAELERICLWCLKKHPSDRPKSANEMAESLWACARGHHHSWWGLLLIPVLSLAGITLSLGLGPRFWSSPEDPATRSILIDKGSAAGGKEGLGHSSNDHYSRAPASEISQPEPASTQKVFVFDGSTRIVTSLKRFAPVTLEAWVRPERYEERSHFVIGSDIATEFGIGLAISGSLLSVEYIKGMIKSKQTVPLREWSHIVGVFGEQETRLYYNGILVGTGPATQTRGDTAFVVGNLGENNPMEYFLGKVRTLRISIGERYRANFTPDEELQPDADAVLVYSGNATEGERVVDLSGHGNDGRIDQLSPP